MNQYHIYEAIGRGKHSTVYKARKKKTIEYFAVKSVDKSQKSKILQEVRILHSLNHHNVLKFYSWYETSAHLWLVLEYCVGGDLLSLLRQDSRLPEDFIHEFALDLVVGLQFLHSKGIIYCDLKPSNILLDENGRIKLCDFGLATRLNEMSNNIVSQAKRGTPCYMAPELFQEEGVHSYASDFWALGCVLYECYAGHPPFVASEFTQLVKSILYEPAPPLPDNPSSAFANLIDCLLTKDPVQRLQWDELCSHGFWKTKLNPVPLPPEPAFSNMIQLFNKQYLFDRNADKPMQQKTPTKYREKNTTKVLNQDDTIIENKTFETPARNINSGRKIQAKITGGKQRDISSATKGVNLLRLSRIARKNLQRENDKENYRKPVPKISENDAEVKIENNDMELDFSENVEEETNDEFDGSHIATCAPAEKPSNLNCDTEAIEGTDDHMDPSCNPMETSMLNSDDKKTTELNSNSGRVDFVASSPSVGLQRKAQCFKDTSGIACDTDSSNFSTNLSDMLWHQSDLSVRPVMPGRKVDKTSDQIFLPSFDLISASDFLKLPSEQVDAFNSKMILILNGNSSLSEKQNAIRYLESLSVNTDVANILSNGPIMLMLVKMFRLSKISALRAQLASAIGSLIRHSTFIGVDLASSGIVGVLSDGLRDKQEKVRRLSMVALGELLFYISTQIDQPRDGNSLELTCKEARSCWQIPSSVIALVSSMLRKGEDDTTQLYALRTLENISSQGSEWATRFTSQDVITNLCYVYKAIGKPESIRLTAGSCLVRLLRFNPPSLQLVLEKLSFKDMTISLLKGSPREQQICLNLLNMAMLGSHILTNLSRHLQSLVEEKQLIPSLVSLIEQGTDVLRGKSLVFVALLCKNGRRWLPHFFCHGRFLSLIDRLTKEKGNYVQECVEAFVSAVVSTIPALLESVCGDIQLLVGGKRRGNVITGRPPPKTNLHYFPVVLHLLGSSSFKNKVINIQILQHLSNILKLLESPFQGRDDVQITLLRIIECVSEESTAILKEPSIFSRCILPSLSVLYKGNKDGDARFLCLKILFDVMIIFFDNMSNPSFQVDEQRVKELKLISHNHFIPLYPSFIEDEDPIPMYAQKLLVMLIEFNFVKVSDILHQSTVSRCFEFLLGDLSMANVNDVKLCLALVSAPEMETQMLSQLRLVRRIGIFLEFVKSKGMVDFLEPTLCLCREFIHRGVINKEQSFDPQQCITDIADFGANMGVLLELSGFHEEEIADFASECVLLLLKAAPREGTTGLLTNLSKISNILESWREIRSNVLLVRLLQSLALSCQNYLSHAMILSISIPDITRIKNIVSDLQNSRLPDVSDAALDVGLQLQRLPHCL